jgi:hypothetical protein
VLIILLAACSASPAVQTTSGGSPTLGAPRLHLPALPVSALPGYVVRTSTLDVMALSAGSLNPGTFETFLTGAGFEGGIERRFTARGKGLTEIVGRVLRFASPSGAGAYLAWFGMHGTDLLGSDAVAATAPDLPRALAFRHGINGCCTKDTYQYVAAWTRGRDAITLLIAGPAARRASALPFATELDALVREKG